MREVMRLLDKIVVTDEPVLIEGESGTGKELVARAIHAKGPRAKQAFLSENCAALTETLLESELFGHVRGAFTGADRDKKGLFELADHGTLFLDEVGDMSPEMQKKLLRVLQEGEIRPVGGKSVRKVDVRIVSASQQGPEEARRGGRVPRGPLLPAEGPDGAPAAAARAEGGHPRARRALPPRCTPRRGAGPRRCTRASSRGWSRTTGRATSASSRTT